MLRVRMIEELRRRLLDHLVEHGSIVRNVALQLHHRLMQSERAEAASRKRIAALLQTVQRSDALRHHRAAERREAGRADMVRHERRQSHAAKVCKIGDFHASFPMSLFQHFSSDF